MKRLYKDGGRWRTAPAAMVLAVLAVFSLGAAAQAAPTSLNVGLIGSQSSINGGSLPTAGTGPTGSFSSFNFTNVNPATVNPATLAAFDTVVLMLASPEMRCSTASLSPSQKTDLNNFVGNGGKLIIYSSECLNTDFSWLVFPFQSNNPGQLGAPGTLTDVEENSLSSTNAASPKFIDDGQIGTQTDAVGDSNVFTTFDPNWFVDMTARNVNAVTGPVHTYARYRGTSSTHTGLIIYNGMDVDLMGRTPDNNGGANNLAKLWLQELQQGWDPDNLQGSVAVVGIALNPPSATNPVGTSHTVTASVKDQAGTPQPGVPVTFEITSGPNAGGTGTCSPANCQTPANGEVTFTYSDTGGAGTDNLRACFTRNSQQVCSATVTKTWQAASGDTTAPTCRVTAVRRGGPNGHDEQDVTVTDAGSGIASFSNFLITNGTITPPAFTPGAHTVVLTAVKAVQGQKTAWSFDVTDVAGNKRHCA
jgi:hypothetical protein